MKRILAIILALTFVVGTAAGCGSDEPVATPPPASTPAPAQEDTTHQDDIAVVDEEHMGHIDRGDWEGIEFSDSPFLAGKGLPPVSERLPHNPKLANAMPPEWLDYQIGKYGGTMRLVSKEVDWDADMFVMNNEGLLNTPGIVGREITGNVLEGFESNDAQTEFTFFLRQGLKWSDGVPVTMEDIRFTLEDLHFNKDFQSNPPAFMHSGGTLDGKLMEFEIIDEWTFKLTFDQPYGGFPIFLAINGWRGYTEMMNPSHILKKYHIDYATDADKAEWPALQEQWGIPDDGDRTWVGILNLLWIRNWDLGRRRAIGYPTLFPWVMVEASEQLYVMERNPYYFKCDSAGQQLPYIDRIESYRVEDMEMVQLMVLAGEVDFSRESASLVNLPLYKENEATGGFTAHMFNMHVTPTDIMINQTYGDDEGYHEVVRDPRFGKALMHAIDREELIDSIYYGFADVNAWQDAEFSIEAAQALFEEMGMEKGSDGYYRRPDGQPFSLDIYHGNEAPDIQPYGELIQQFWRDAGINATVRSIHSSLVGNRQAANELSGRIIWTHTPLWYFMDWGWDMWARSWQIFWAGANTATITHEDGRTETIELRGERPPANVQAFHDLVMSTMTVPVTEAWDVFTAARQSMNENYWYLVPLQNVKQPLIINSDIKNVGTNGFAIGVNFSAEHFWYDR